MFVKAVENVAQDAKLSPIKQSLREKSFYASEVATITEKIGDMRYGEAKVIRLSDAEQVIDDIVKMIDDKLKKLGEWNGLNGIARTAQEVCLYELKQQITGEK